MEGLLEVVAWGVRGRSPWTPDKFSKIFWKINEKLTILMDIFATFSNFFKNFIEFFVKILRNLAANFCPFGQKQIKIWNFWENFKIYIRKSQWKLDFQAIFSPIFKDLCHFIQLWKIPPFFYNSFSGFRGGGSPPPAGSSDYLFFSRFNTAFLIYPHHQAPCLKYTVLSPCISPH